MSELFGKDVSSQLSSRNVMKDDFGWEIPHENVPIPSNGVIYNPDTELYNTKSLQIKAMTAKEEDILSSQALIKEGTVITHLIKSCVVNKDISPEDLISGDRNALMIAIRITGYGADYSYSATCNSCGARNKNVARLDSLPIKRLEIKPVSPGKNEFEYTLPVTKKKVTFKFMTERDDRDREASEKFIRNNTDGKFNNKVTSFLEHTVLSIDGVRDKNKIKHFIMNMPAFDSKSLRKFIVNSEPGMDMTVNFECSECGDRNETNLPVTTEFFWPRT